MALNKVTADSIADGTVVASDIADGTITLAKLQSGLLPPATANSAAAYANAAFATANTGSASGSYANSAFATANTGTAAGSYANSAFASANLISGVNTTQNTNITNAGTYANSAFATANTGSASGSYANSAFAKANTAGTGTVTSVATGNGLSGGTITSTGTLVIACPDFNSVGSYTMGMMSVFAGTVTATQGSNYAAGSGLGSSQVGAVTQVNTNSWSRQNALSGTWKWMGPTQSASACGTAFVVAPICRVS